MTRLLYLSLICLTLFLAPHARAVDRPPNIILILADDIGMGGIGCYGADAFKTPNIDRLAASGIRFERCYAAPLCGPSRAMLLTGRYAFRTGMTGNDSGPLIKPANEFMLPQLLKKAGYITAHVGKWSQLPLEPADFGFDEYLRFKASGAYWNTQDKAKSYTLNGKQVPLKDGQYLPDLMHTFLIDFIARNADKPFFAYYPMSHIHNEILPTPDSAPDSKDLYRDNIVYMDKLVGQLTAELDRRHLTDNTLIIFLGDNGTVGGETPRSTIGGKTINGAKGTMLEGGSRVPAIVSFPSVIRPGQVTSNLIDFSDFFPTLADLAASPPPTTVTLDGKSFAATLRGDPTPTRESIFVELGRRWYVRNDGWKLNEAGELFDMSQAPFVETLVPPANASAQALAARKTLQATLDKLAPEKGIVDQGDGSGKHANRQNKPQGKAQPKTN